MTVHETLTIYSLRDGRELHLETPEWYFDYEGNVSITTPFSSYVTYNKSEKSHRPISKDLIINNYLNPSPPIEKETKIPTNQIAFKPFGCSREFYEVVVTEQVVETYCETMPVITIVSERNRL